MSTPLKYLGLKHLFYIADWGTFDHASSKLETEKLGPQTLYNRCHSTAIFRGKRKQP